MDWIKKMAGAMLLMVLVCAALICPAQTYSEWFRQKKTQKKYLLQQIAALEVYSGYLKKGYKIVDGSMQTIKGFTGGEFKLHEGFISSLKLVSPAVRNDSRIAEIIALQIGVLNAFGSIKGSDFLSAENLAYIGLVAAEISSECYKDLEELLVLISSGKLEMKEDERLARLGALHLRMLDKAAFARDFVAEVSLLARAREAEKHELEQLIRMYHLKE